MTCFSHLPEKQISYNFLHNVMSYNVIGSKLQWEMNSDVSRL